MGPTCWTPSPAREAPDLGCPRPSPSWRSIPRRRERPSSLLRYHPVLGIVVHLLLAARAKVRAVSRIADEQRGAGPDRPNRFELSERDHAVEIDDVNTSRYSFVEHDVEVVGPPSLDQAMLACLPHCPEPPAPSHVLRHTISTEGTKGVDPLVSIDGEGAPPNPECVPDRREMVDEPFHVGEVNGHIDVAMVPIS